LEQAQLPRQLLLDQRIEQLLLGAEVVVEGADRDVGLLGDLGDRRLLHAARGIQPPRGGQQGDARARLAALHASFSGVVGGGAAGHVGFLEKILGVNIASNLILYSVSVRGPAAGDDALPGGAEMDTEQTPVLIVGGGGAGLTASMLLAR